MILFVKAWWRRASPSRPAHPPAVRATETGGERRHDILALATLYPVRGGGRNPAATLVDAMVPLSRLSLDPLAGYGTSCAFGGCSFATRDARGSSSMLFICPAKVQLCRG